ncbi:hypothetical protein [Halalkalicoccus sp. NIPERK01]|uniref:hypothetical protein n=1 Tax=Halalkalicoccus sp. NIPERK01 TaxID=3053469 RepID=UPI00256F14F9|nr:hypothetical protein [Halalkalicoccus sp. NIPERK01]MDL5362135.1 hypothetical protein [Halalkalicoccus sp. NIPERK01]
MIRAIVGLVGVLTALFPDETIAVFEAAAVEHPAEYRRRSGIGSGIRAEGLLVAVASLVGGRAYGRMMDLTGAFGAVLVLFPELYREVAAALLYERPDEVEWHDRFTDRVRFIGAVYAVLAAWEFAKRRAND